MGKTSNSSSHPCRRIFRGIPLILPERSFTMRISPRDFRRNFFSDYFILRKLLQPRRNENAAAYPNVACFAFDSITSEIVVFGRFEKMLLDAVFSHLEPFDGAFKETAVVDV